MANEISGLDARRIPAAQLPFYRDHALFSHNRFLQASTPSVRLGGTKTFLSTTPPASMLAPLPKSLPEIVFDRNGHLKIAFLHISMHLEPRWRDRIFAQLNRLLEPEEWEADEQLPSEQSFSTLLRLILHVRPQRVPGLGLTSSGNFVASWSVGDDHLTIECVEADTLLWSLIKTNGGERQAASGNAKIGRISFDLDRFEAKRWFQDTTVGQSSKSAERQ